MTVILTAIGSFFVGIFKILSGKEGRNAQIAAFILIGLVLGALLLCGLKIRSYFAPSELENTISNRAPQIIESQANSDVAGEGVKKSEGRVKETEKASQNARNERERAREANTSNSSFDSANKARCEVFRESAECKNQ